MKEVWKDISGYEGLYQVSNFGRVKSLKCRREKILKLEKTKDNYLTIRLSKDKTRKHIGVHRLVAQAFISNPDNLSQVNHKDENKENNFVENLEWCTQVYNMSYGTRVQRLSMEVNQYDLQGNFIKKWNSIKEAERQLHIRHISDCCKEKVISAGGYIWKYTDNDKIIIRENKRKRKVIQYDLQGNFVNEWNCIKDIERKLGFNNRNISACCRNKRPTAYGFIWKYRD